MKVPDL